MKNLTKILTICLTISLICVCFTGCKSKKEAKDDTISKVNQDEEETTDTDKSNKSSDEAVTLTLGFWGSSGEEKAFTKAVEGIAGAVPEIKEIKLQHYPTANDFWQKLPGEVAAGTAPDIVNLTNEASLGLIQDGFFLPYDEYDFDFEAYAPSAIKAWNYQGQLYGIPTTAAPATFAVNVDLWKAAGLGDYPETWEEVYEAAKALTKDEVKGVCIDIGNIYHPTQYMNSFGGGWKDGASINSKENIDALNFIFKMFDEGLAVTAKDAGMSWDGEVFGGQKCAMSTGGTWYVGFMKESAPDVDYTFIPMPGGDGNKGSTLHTYAYSVLKNTKNAELAAKAAYYMSRKEFQLTNAEITGGSPSITEALPKFFELNPKLKIIEEQVPYATGFGYPADEQFKSDFQSELESVIYGNSDKSAEEILNNLSEKYGSQ
ncbi:hypothetical protein SH1V18_26830 [Vallitalea longa]|uniref:Uncharacterized protein n=1 Tax=Vallitalea longa TaxID=2936439 RepID=A0A9W5YD67_9FIRM|nr:sugar ABC transporter substrate-binding protein [Vallitalea longa]GKX30203.1 hypothetical protein SH1V18_26830 [Vallitalea longa]